MNRVTKIITAIAINLPVIAAAAAAQSANPPANLELNFNGIETPKGNIMIALFDSEEAYNSDKAIRTIAAPADKADVKTLVNGLVPGRYAIKSFHDIDSNNQMGTNPYGMPTEPFAFSNNARGQMGPASWKDAAFDIKAGSNTAAITIQ